MSPEAFRNVDLHTHSACSDGTVSPAELVRIAHRAGLEALILTDHNTVAGVPEARREAESLGQRFAGGIEINTREGDCTHILGYGIDPTGAGLQDLLAGLRRHRRERVERIVELLQRLGVQLDLEDIRTQSDETVGRPHVADALLRKGVVRTRSEAFRRFLRRGGPAHVGSVGPTVPEAIAAIRDAGGWASLAHPGLLSRKCDLGPWVDAGLEGIEVYYPSHTRSQMRRFLETAERYRLLATGGSDFHGPRTDNEKIGGIRMPPEAFDRIEGRLGLIGGGA
ncbi:PHP domain-containing protein [Elusimicrobiota bacterium]